MERDLDRLPETLAASRVALDLTPSTVERVVRTALRPAHRRELTLAESPDGLDAPAGRDDQHRFGFTMTPDAAQ